MTGRVSASGGPISDERIAEIRAAAGYEFNPGTISLSAAWELIHEVDRLRAVLTQQEEALKQITKLIPSAEFAGSNAVFIARSALTGVRSDG